MHLFNSLKQKKKKETEIRINRIICGKKSTHTGIKELEEDKKKCVVQFDCPRDHRVVTYTQLLNEI